MKKSENESEENKGMLCRTLECLRCSVDRRWPKINLEMNLKRPFSWNCEFVWINPRLWNFIIYKGHGVQLTRTSNPKYCGVLLVSGGQKLISKSPGWWFWRFEVVSHRQENPRKPLRFGFFLLKLSLWCCFLAVFLWRLNYFTVFEKVHLSRVIGKRKGKCLEEYFNFLILWNETVIGRRVTVINFCGNLLCVNKSVLNKRVMY